MLTDRGRPPMITREWFRSRYGQNFPDLLEEGKNEFLDNCINDTYSMFHGVGDLWSHMERKEYEEKTQLCYGLLVAWYITDLFPDYALGVTSSGGIPLKAKKIGGVQVQFYEQGSTTSGSSDLDLLQSLKSNAFGAKAYTMIRTAGKVHLFIKR